MVDARLDEKINKLAHEIETLKARLPTDGGWPTSPSRLQRSMSFLIANWVLLSFVVALLTATYAKIAFDIDPFQAYRDAAAKKSLSEFYRKTGDLMMDSGALPEAKRSYDEALKINPYNTEATFGLAKAQVYPGETEVVSAKLDFLSAQRPHDGHVHWLNARRYRLLGNSLKYEHEVELCIKERVQAIVCYVELGYIRQGQGNLEDAKANFLKAIKVSPISQLANNNLGFYWLISLEFSSAIKQFEEADTIERQMLTEINLGDAYRYSGDFRSARFWHQEALTALSQMSDRDHRYFGGNWRLNYMPLKRGDTTTITDYISCFDLKEKEAVAHAALGTDLAVLGEFRDAEREFDAGLDRDSTPEFKKFLHNKIQSTVNLVSMTGNARNWLEQRLKALDSQPK